MMAPYNRDGTGQPYTETGGICIGFLWYWGTGIFVAAAIGREILPVCGESGVASSVASELRVNPRSVAIAN